MTDEEIEQYKIFDRQPKNFKQVLGYSHLQAISNCPTRHICPNCSSKSFNYCLNLNLYWCISCDNFFQDEPVSDVRG